jgi:hypothetical protein
LLVIAFEKSEINIRISLRDDIRPFDLREIYGVF